MDMEIAISTEQDGLIKERRMKMNIIEVCMIMVETGAREEVVLDYVEYHMKRGNISTRLYELLIGMIIDSY